MEVPRLGVKSELQLPTYTTVQAASATYGTAYGNARSLTHCARPGIEPTSSWILVGFVTTETQWELLVLLLFFFFFKEGSRGMESSY